MINWKVWGNNCAFCEVASCTFCGQKKITGSAEVLTRVIMKNLIIWEVTSVVRLHY